MPASPPISRFTLPPLTGEVSERPNYAEACAESTGRRHLLTVALEDYYQVGAFNRLIQRGQWYRFETRIERSARHTLDLLDEFGITATFFALGWIADEAPEVVRLIAERGHEIASKGYYHRNIKQLTPDEFREDLARAREALERASGRRVLGYRVADDWLLPADLWALDVLAEEGYAYDSSLAPRLRSFASEPWRRFAHRHRAGERLLWEFPISSASLFGLPVPIAGGNYLRQFPHALVSRGVARWDRACSAPLVMYFHTWELDPDQPKITAAPLHARVRHYRNLRTMPAKLRHYFGRYRFTGIAAHLGISTASSAPATRGDASRGPHLATAVPRFDRPRTPATVVVPCYNEEQSLGYLARTLRSVREALGERYDLRFIFVDDASTDETPQLLARLFGDDDLATIIRHPANRGITGSVRTGLRAAGTEIVCSIDCDCSYDPHELGRMIPLLTEGVDLVTASPYHPDGAVVNVPQWRLALSRSLSRLYRLALRNKLSTYTSCFRVYRRSAVVDLPITRSNFLGMAELVGRLDVSGGRIVEHPATLEVRIFGWSKMKYLNTIGGHLVLLAELAWTRLRGGSTRAPAPTSEPVDVASA